MGCRSTIAFCLFVFLLGNGYAQIPISVLRRVRKLSTEEFIDEYLRINQNPAGGNGTGVTGSQGQQLSSSGRIPQDEKENLMERLSHPDHCGPHLVTVPVPQDPDPSVSQFPQCVLMERCAGCEGSAAEICAPTETTYGEVVVLVARYNLGSNTGHFNYNEVKTIYVEKHLACESRCKIQPSDCDYRVHRGHDDETCQCICKNAHKQSSCVSPKIWDAERCECICPYVKNCDSSRSAFNTDTCRCERRSLSSASGSGLRSSANDPSGSIVDYRGLDNSTVERLRGMVSQDGSAPQTTQSPTTTTTPEPTTTTPEPTTPVPTPTQLGPCTNTCDMFWKPVRLSNGRCGCELDVGLFGNKKRK